MQLARIIVLVLVAIAITAAIAVGVGTVGNGVGAQEYPLVIRDTGKVDRVGAYCVYRLSVDDNRHPEDRRQYARYELRHFLSIQSTFEHGGTIQADGKIEISHGYDYIIMPTDDYGRDTYIHGMPTRAEAAIGRWYWNVIPPRSFTRAYAGEFNGPYAEDLHEALLECANAIIATPTPSPTATPTETPIPQATATPSPTATTAPPAVIPGPATPTPTATPRTSPALTDPTATPTVSPTPSPTATPVPGGEEPSVDDSDIVAAILALIEVLKAWIESQ